MLILQLIPNKIKHLRTILWSYCIGNDKIKKTNFVGLSSDNKMVLSLTFIKSNFYIYEKSVTFLQLQDKIHVNCLVKV